MQNLTELDRAHEKMQANERDAAAQLRFYERLADAELFLMLEKEPDGGVVEPKIFPFEGQKYALIFDLEERLVEFADAIVPYVALSGRAVTNMLAGKDIGLGVNLGVAPSSILLPSQAIEWLWQKTSAALEVAYDRPIEISKPVGVSEVLLAALGTKLALATGMAKSAYLANASFASGRSGPLLAFVDAPPASEPALSQAVSEALVFSGIEVGTLDVAFLVSSDKICAVLARVGLRFDIPQTPDTVHRQMAPGFDPDKPPRLR